MKTTTPQKLTIPFNQVIDALLDITQPFPARFLHRLSDLPPQEVESLKSIWPSIDPNRRAALMEDLEELAENDTIICFDDIARFALDDSDMRVRATALRILWENDDAKLIPIYIKMMKEDQEAFVRASAATALGIFVYTGELEEISPVLKKTVVDNLIFVLNGNEEALVRRRALESLGYSGRKAVSGFIQSAFDSGNSDWMASALFAMGRSSDDAWEETVVSMIDHEEVDVQLEAVRAAGQLGLGSAVEPMLELLENAEEMDEEVRAAVIWALSQIGGEEAVKALENLLDEIEDEEEAEYIEEALENLVFNQGLANVDIFNLSADDEDIKPEAGEHGQAKSNDRKSHKRN